MITLEFDGMVHIDEQSPVGGLLGFGWLIAQDIDVLAHGFGVVGRKAFVTANAAEYLALVEGLDALINLRLWHIPIEIRGDAKGVIDQMIGRAAINSPAALELHQQARRLARRFDHIEWVWVPRSKNKSADRLSRRGLRQLHNIPGAYEKAVQRLQCEPVKNRDFISFVDLRVYQPASI
jgi:ribonuclease HI